MKQALTAAGSISVWMKSAELAFYRLGIDFEEDSELSVLKGVHSEYGEITIHFVVPVQGKTRMEIAVQNAAFIAEFKKIIVPAYRYVSESMTSQIKTRPAGNDASPKNIDNVKIPKTGSDAAGQTENQPSAAGGTTADTEQIKPAKSGKQQETQHCKFCHAALREGDKVCPQCGKKQNKGLVIAGVIAGILILAGLIGFAVYQLTKGQDSNAPQTTTDAGNNTETTENSDTQTTDQSQLVSLDQYHQIQKGMSYEQICAIMGKEGTFLEPETQIADGDGQTKVLRTYYWSAQGPQGANICITFSNDAVAVFTQYGLE